MGKRQRQEEVSAASSEPDWDVPVAAPAPADDFPLEHVLQADEVAAVRFHVARRGYSCREVEIFVGQVQESLVRLEQAIYDKDVSLHEAREEVRFYEDRVSTLQATIEVFRAKGDPVMAEDGSYVTESQLRSEDADALRAENARLARELEDLRAGLGGGSDDVQRLQALLDAERQRRQEAEQAEQEMREYVEVTLAAWLASHDADRTDAASEGNAPSGLAADRQEIDPSWDAPAPDPDAEAGDSASDDRIGILLSAPEIAGASIDPAGLARVPHGTLDGLPAAPERKRASLESAPELASPDPAGH